MDERTFCERLKCLLAEKKKTQAELAKETGCTEAAISHYIKGDRIPRASVLAKLAIALDTTSDYLMEGVPVNTKSEFGYAKKLLARNASNLTAEEKSEIINILIGANIGKS